MVYYSRPFMKFLTYWMIFMTVIDISLLIGNIICHNNLPPSIPTMDIPSCHNLRDRCYHVNCGCNLCIINNNFNICLPAIADKICSTLGGSFDINSYYNICKFRLSNEKTLCGVLDYAFMTTTILTIIYGIIYGYYKDTKKKYL